MKSTYLHMYIIINNLVAFIMSGIVFMWIHQFSLCCFDFLSILRGN